MINLKKLFRRKKGQGALEYLFMIAAALIIIFVVVRYISSSGQQATGQSDIASLQSQAELAKSALQAKGWWDDNYYVDNPDDGIISIGSSSGGNDIANITVSNSRYYNDIKSASINGKTLSQLYNGCMGGNATLCKVLAAMGGT